MSVERDGRARGADGGDRGAGGGSPGKGALTDRLPVQRRASATDAPTSTATASPPAGADDPYGMHLLDTSVQRRASGPGPSDEQVHAAAAHGTSGAGGALPHQDVIQRAFGRHDVSGIRAHTDGAAAQGAQAMGAEAFATGDHVAFAGAPSLHTAAHEAAHVVQQRAGVHLKGGVGAEGDVHERHADEVADAVVAGRSAEALLDRYGGSGGGGGVQRVVNSTTMDKLMALGQGFGEGPAAPLAPEAPSLRASIKASWERSHVLETFRTEYAAMEKLRLVETQPIHDFAAQLEKKTNDEIRAKIPEVRRIAHGIANAQAIRKDPELRAGYGAFQKELDAYHTLLAQANAGGLLRAPKFVIDQVFGKSYEIAGKPDEKGAPTRETVTVTGASAGNLDVEVADALAKMYDLKLATSTFISLLAQKEKHDLVGHFTQFRDQEIDKDKDFMHAGLQASRGMTTTTLADALARGKKGKAGGSAAPLPFANEGDKLGIDVQSGYMPASAVPGFAAFQQEDPTRAGWLAQGARDAKHADDGASPSASPSSAPPAATSSVAPPSSSGGSASSAPLPAWPPAAAATAFAAGGPAVPIPPDHKPAVPPDVKDHKDAVPPAAQPAPAPADAPAAGPADHKAAPGVKPNIDHLVNVKELGSGLEGDVNLFESAEADYNEALPVTHRPRYAGKTTRSGGRATHSLFREAAAYAHLGEHKNLPRVHGFGVVPHGQDKRPGLIMDFVQGPNGEVAMNLLKAQMEAQTITPVHYWGAIQFICRRLIDVIKLMASKGLAHNDIKPENFVIGADGEPVMIDLGLHTQAGAHKEKTPTELRGRTEQLAPTQIARQISSGEETDLFLVAATMLAGVNGWHHDSKAAWQPRQGYVEESVHVNARAKGNLIDGRDLHAEFRAFVDLVIKKDAQATTKVAAAEKLAFLSTPIVSDEQAQATLKGTIVAERREPTLAEQIVDLHEPDDKGDEKDAKAGTYVTTRTPPRDEGEEKRARDRAARAEKAKQKAAAARDEKGGH